MSSSQPEAVSPWQSSIDVNDSEKSVNEDEDVINDGKSAVKETLKLKRSSVSRVKAYMVGDLDITQVHPSWKGKAKLPDGTRRSLWWLCFHVVKVAGQEPQAACNLCGKKVSMAGTSTMKRHIVKCNFKVYTALHVDSPGDMLLSSLKPAQKQAIEAAKKEKEMDSAGTKEREDMGLDGETKVESEEESAIEVYKKVRSDPQTRKKLSGAARKRRYVTELEEENERLRRKVKQLKRKINKLVLACTADSDEDSEEEFRKIQSPVASRHGDDDNMAPTVGV